MTDERFERELERCRPRIRQHCARLCSREVDDLLQDVMVNAWKFRKQYREDESFLNWLFRIATNRNKDIVRNRGRRCDEYSMDSTSFEGELFWDLSPSPEESLIAEVIPENLALAVKSISPKLRIPFLRARIDGIPYEEVATELGLTHTAARSRIHRASVLIKEALR